MWVIIVGWRIVIADSYSVGKKCRDKKEFLVIRFSFLVETASVISLLCNDRKKEKYKIQDAGYFFEKLTFKCNYIIITMKVIKKVVIYESYYNSHR
jgi:hypothetical protein